MSSVETIGSFKKIINPPSLMQSVHAGSGNYLIFKNLMGAIIHQLAESVANNKEFKRCLECCSWLEASNQGRLGKIYCSNSCRAKAQRRRDGIKYLYEHEKPNGKFSLKNQINDFCKAYNQGPENLEAGKKFEEQLKNKPKSKSLLTSIRYNILDNLSVMTSKQSIAEHLDISEDYLQNIDFTEAFGVVLSLLVNILIILIGIEK